MNVKSTAAMVSVLLAAAGCHYFLPPTEPQIGQVPERNSVRSGGLELTVELAKRRFTVGETFTVQITARNLTEHSMKFAADSDALHRVRILQKDRMAWRQIRTYPESVMKARRHWVLPAGKTAGFTRRVQVRRDWPVDEPLRLTVELTGRPDVTCAIIVSVAPTRQRQK